MARRILALMSLMVLGLAGCTTYGGSHYRDGHYSDGGYYYPAEDGYGDYYQGREYVDYRYHDDYRYWSYSPFWRLDRYYCGAFHSCSPYWDNYYRRPYSGWSISYGRGWGLGYGGWHGSHWSPWHGHGHYDRGPTRRDRDRRPPVVYPGPRGGYSSGTDPDLGRPGPRLIGGEPDARHPDLDGGSRLPPPGAETGFAPRPGSLGRPAPGRFGPGMGPRPRPEDGYVRPVPVRRVVDDDAFNGKAPARPAPQSAGGFGSPAPSPIGRAPAPPRFERAAAPPPQASRSPLRVERPPSPEVGDSSQNRSLDEEQ